MICQKLWRQAWPRNGFNVRTPGVELTRQLLIVVALMGLFAGGAVAVEQATGPESARTPRLEEQWKAKLNANTVYIIAGSPEETYLDVTHDLAVVLNDDNLRIVPMVGMGGAQNIRDVLYLKGVDIGITTSQMLRYFASTGELSTALDQRLTYITRLYPGRNARRRRPRRPRRSRT